MRKRWRDLPPHERRDLMRAAAYVPLAHGLVRVIGYQRLRTVAEAAADRWPLLKPLDPNQPVIDSLALAIGRVQQYSPLGGNCLSRSLALWWLLKRHGISSDLRLGVSLNGGTFAAHAWVECEGRVLNDDMSVSERFRPLGS